MRLLRRGASELGRTAFGGGGGASTLNPADKDAGVTLSGGDLTATGTLGSGYQNARSTIGKNTGDLYFEVLVTTGGGGLIGVGNASATLTNYLGVDANSCGYADSNFLGYNGGASFPGSGYSNGSTVGVLVKFSTKEIWFTVNGTPVFGDANARTGGQTIAAITGDLFAMFSDFNATVHTYNFAGSFSNLPTGASAWG